MLTKKDAGLLVPRGSANEMLVGIVDLAIAQGFDIKMEEWTPDREIFLTGEPTEEMLLDLVVVADFSLQYLEEELDIGLELDFSRDGLSLLDKTVDWT